MHVNEHSTDERTAWMTAMISLDTATGPSKKNGRATKSEFTDMFVQVKKQGMLKKKGNRFNSIWKQQWIVLGQSKEDADIWLLAWFKNQSNTECSSTLSEIPSRFNMSSID